jgi:hypothetical protein
MEEGGSLNRLRFSVAKIVFGMIPPEGVPRPLSTLDNVFYQ